MITATVKGLSKLQKAVKAESKRQNKALERAIRVEGYRIRKEMKEEMRAGAPGGQRFAPLSFIARRASARPRPNNPLTAKTDPWGIGHGGYSMANAIRYGVKSRSPFSLAIGWTDADVAGRYKLSESWKRLARIHQKGFTRGVTEFQRRWLANRGAALGTIEGGRTPFFLKKSTRYFHTPARPVIDPYWRKHKGESLRNIRSNFLRKLKGERI